MGSTYIRLSEGEVEALSFSAGRYESSEAVQDALIECEEPGLFEVNPDAFFQILDACENEDGAPFPNIGGNLIVKLHQLRDHIDHVESYGPQKDRIIE